MGKRNLTRRQFMASLATGAGTVIFGNAVTAIPEYTGSRGKDPLKKISLGNSGIRTTFLGMGTGFSGYNRTSSITRAGVAEAMIRSAYEKGLRYFDCADSYGTHSFTASALKGIPRENYTLGTKIWVTSGGIPEKERPDAKTVIDRFRSELKTDYLDLVQLHCLTAGDWTDQQKRYMDDLETLKARKIIRAHGVSVHSLEAMEAAAESQWVDIIHVRINPYGEAMDKKDPSLVVPVIEKIHKSGKGVIGMKLIGNGKFKNDPGKIENSLKYVLGLGIIDMIIIGFELPEQIDNYIHRVKNALNRA
jgi:aryl-alcohol dehydrogenase-like predicted oxidoreductase